MRAPVQISVTMEQSDTYEVLSADMVGGIVTEIRLLPSSSAPAVLRVKQQTFS